MPRLLISIIFSSKFLFVHPYTINPVRSTSAVSRVISQLEDIFRMHHPTRNNYCILHNEKCEKP